MHVIPRVPEPRDCRAHRKRGEHESQRIVRPIERGIERFERFGEVRGRRVERFRERFQSSRCIEVRGEWKIIIIIIVVSNENVLFPGVVSEQQRVRPSSSSFVKKPFDERRRHSFDGSGGGGLLLCRLVIETNGPKMVPNVSLKKQTRVFRVCKI